MAETPTLTAHRLPQGVEVRCTSSWRTTDSRMPITPRAFPATVPPLASRRQESSDSRPVAIDRKQAPDNECCQQQHTSLGAWAHYGLGTANEDLPARGVENRALYWS